ncbi:MAG: hypothetical protein JSU00_01005 [Acidobacteria bacterium]|nr:hypothetical protein [Acidobacteriota bacterium]
MINGLSRVVRGVAAGSAGRRTRMRISPRWDGARRTGSGSSRSVTAIPSRSIAPNVFRRPAAATRGEGIQIWGSVQSGGSGNSGAGAGLGAGAGAGSRGAAASAM